MAKRGYKNGQMMTPRAILNLVFNDQRPKRLIKSNVDKAVNDLKTKINNGGIHENDLYNSVKITINELFIEILAEVIDHENLIINYKSNGKELN